jgi:hypothetical protein
VKRGATPFAWVISLLVAVSVCAACGKKGAPLPPLLRMPAPVHEPVALRIGDDVYVRFAVPTANVDGRTPADIARVEVYAVTAERAPTPQDDAERLREVSTLIATEQVRRPAPPLPPVKPGEPEPPPLPLAPGVDQGATVVVRESLNASARVPVPLPVPETRARPEATDVEPLPGPLVAPLESQEPMRYYYVVGVSPNGRYGPAQPFMPVPLGRTSSAPSAPVISYDEKTLTIKWTPPADARAGQPASLPDVLPSRSLAPESPPTMYDVYDVPRVPEVPEVPGEPTVPQAPGNETPSVPSPVNPGPLGELQLTLPIAALGVERCFYVRPVDILQGYHVRGPASSTTCVTLADTFAPGPAKSLAAVASGGAINLIWEPSDAADVAGYLILRGEAPGATLTPLTPAPTSATTFVDRDVRLGVTYVYVVVAVDKAGNRSAESNRVEETAR